MEKTEMKGREWKGTEGDGREWKGRAGKEGKPLFKWESREPRVNRTAYAGHWGK